MYGSFWKHVWQFLEACGGMPLLLPLQHCRNLTLAPSHPLPARLLTMKFSSQVGPVPIDDGFGKEVVLRLSSSLASTATFYTDSNGRDFIQRTRNFRPDWNLTVTEPAAGNYYPVSGWYFVHCNPRCQPTCHTIPVPGTTAFQHQFLPSLCPSSLSHPLSSPTATTRPLPHQLNAGIYLHDNNTDFSVLVDRPSGATSLSDGQVEVMLHRRLLHDDHRGVAEPLNERVCVGGEEGAQLQPPACMGLVVSGFLRFGLHPHGRGDGGVVGVGGVGGSGEGLAAGNGTEEGVEVAAEWRRGNIQRIFSPLQVAFAVEVGGFGGVRMEHSFLRTVHTCASSFPPCFSLSPPSLPLLQEVHEYKVLLRVAHLYQAEEDPILSQPARVDLDRLFAHQEIEKVTELSLMANQKLSKMRPPMKWRTEEEVESTNGIHGVGQRDAFDSTDGPYIVELGPMEIRTFAVHFDD
ncbi:unnamed protein product [Closterium sp. Naga37s-1]|nr:unnamed protein product [Closterium sp. Naga37s-1]